MFSGETHAQSEFLHHWTTCDDFPFHLPGEEANTGQQLDAALSDSRSWVIGISLGQLWLGLLKEESSVLAEMQNQR